MLASSGQLVKLVTYFKHALGSSMLRGGKPISSKLNRSGLKGGQLRLTRQEKQSQLAITSSLLGREANRGETRAAIEE